MGFYSTFANYIEGVCAEKGLHYYERSWEEFFGDFDGVQFPCLLLDRHDFMFEDRQSDNIFKKREVAFIIAEYVPDKTDKVDFRAKLDNAEDKVDSVLNRMKADTRSPQTSPLRGMDFNEVEAVGVENEAVGAWGYSVVCTVEMKHDITT